MSSSFIGRNTAAYAPGCRRSGLVLRRRQSLYSASVSSGAGMDTPGMRLWKVLIVALAFTLTLPKPSGLFLP
jgi:hypothetical protein